MADEQVSRYSLGELMCNQEEVVLSMRGCLPMQGTIVGLDGGHYADKYIVFRESPPLHVRVHVLHVPHLVKVLVFDRPKLAKGTQRVSGKGPERASPKRGTRRK